MVLKLSRILRRLLRKHENFTTLRDELDFIDDYLAIVAGYAQAYGLTFTEVEALEWAKRRGARSGRVAWQFVTELAGAAGRSI